MTKRTLDTIFLIGLVITIAVYWWTEEQGLVRLLQLWAGRLIGIWVLRFITLYAALQSKHTFTDQFKKIALYSVLGGIFVFFMHGSPSAELTSDRLTVESYRDDGFTPTMEQRWQAGGSFALMLFTTATLGALLARRIKPGYME